MTIWLTMTRDERTAAIAAGQRAGLDAQRLAKQLKTAPSAIEAHAARIGIPLADDSRGSDGQPPANADRRPQPSTGTKQPTDGGRHVADPIASTKPQPAPRALSTAPATHRHYAGVGWTEERKAALRDLLQGGYSASQIAAMLGGGLSRNAVIGVVHRQGLALTGAKPAHSNIPRQPRRPRSTGPRPTLDRAIARARAVANPAPRPLRPSIDVLEPISRGYSLMSLPPSTCKFPSATDDVAAMTFCGHGVFNEQVYCEYHCRIAYIPAAERRRYERRNGLEA